MTTERGLKFKIRGAKNAISHILIDLDNDDTYTVRFVSVRAGVVREKSVFDGVYVDVLHRTIEQATGLYTSL